MTSFMVIGKLATWLALNKWLLLPYKSPFDSTCAMGLVQKIRTTLSQPIRFKTTTNRDLVTRIFPRFTKFVCFQIKFSLAPLDLLIYSFLWLAIALTMILILWNSVEKRFVLDTIDLDGWHRGSILTREKYPGK